MNHLFRHIDYLLLRRDCVIVPGFGAFIASDEPARIDREAGMVYAPVRRVMFNQAVVSDDGLLATSVARKLSVSFEDARQIVAREVDSLHKILCSEKTLDCGSLGHLEMTEEGTIVFHPLLITLGYEDFSVNPKNNATPSDEIVCEEGNDDIEQTEKISRSPFRNFFSGIRNIPAAVALIFAMTLAVVLNPIPRDTREERASVVPVDVLIPLNEKEEESSSIENIPAISDNLEVEAEVSSVEKEVVVTHPTHFLIVGTFSSRQEADRFITMRSTEEFPLMAIESRKLTRVALASSDNRDSLRRRLNSAKVLKEFPGSWIWTSDK